MKTTQDYDLVLLLGGTGSRMNYKPNGNKHLVKVGDKTVVEHIKNKIDIYENAVAPFKNKYVVTNGKGVDEIMSILGQDYKYYFQAKPTGIPDAAYLPNPKNPFLLHLGDQFYSDNIGQFIQGFGEVNENMRVWLKETDDTNHNTALLDGDGNIKRFVEKPNYGNGIKGYVATGMYMLQPHLKRTINQLPRHDKEENDMADLGNLVLQESKLGYRQMKGYWYDVGNQYIRNEAEKQYGKR